MNERIKKLINEAFISTTDGKLSDLNTVANVEKFADLIVRECVRYFNEDYQRDFNTLWREDLTKGIKKHFGVEE